MNQETNTSKTKLCPVCGTRINDSANKCLVCGTELDSLTDKKKSETVRAKRLPEITLSLPAALALLALFITLGAVVVFLVLQPNPQTEISEDPQQLGTATASPTVTMTPTITLTPTEAPTWTPLPPLEYTVNPGDSCAGVAAAFSVSVQSIILANNLPANCELSVGQVLSIPQPTPTASPQPSATLSEAEKTEVACNSMNYTVQANDTLSSISSNYNVSMATIREYNSLFSDTVFEGQTLIIPLCERLPTPGPTPTATERPPYPGPNLLLPANGASFTSSTDIITLQWAAVGELEPNEAYAVTITDLTSETQESSTVYVVDTTYIVPASFIPESDRPHIFQWTVFIARQIGSGEGDNGDGGTWVSAGNRSEARVFGWFTAGTGSTTNTD